MHSQELWSVVGATGKESAKWVLYPFSTIMIEIGLKFQIEPKHSMEKHFPGIVIGCANWLSFPSEINVNAVML